MKLSEERLAAYRECVECKSTFGFARVERCLRCEAGDQCIFDEPPPYVVSWFVEHIDALTAENEWVREALRTALNWAGPVNCELVCPDCEARGHCRSHGLRTARFALDQEADA